MTATATMRQEIQSFIECVPDEKIPTLRSLVEFLADEPLIIETDLTDEEKRIIKRDAARFKTHPEEFVSWKKLKNS